VPAHGPELGAAHPTPMAGVGKATLDVDDRWVIGVNGGLNPDREGLRRTDLDLVGERGAIVLGDVTKNDLKHERLIGRRQIAKLHR
jgi:hypothetical protein